MAELTLRPNQDVSKGIEYPAGTHYTEIDEEVADDNTTYLGQTGYDEEGIDYIGIANPAVMGDISNVRLYVRGLGTNFSHCYVKIKTHNNLYGTIDCSGSSYETKSKDWATNPNTSSAWTWQEITDLQIYIELNVWDGGCGELSIARCTQAYIVVTYTPAYPPTVTTTTPPSVITHNSATLGGEVTDDDGKDITERGFEYEKISIGSTVDQTSSAGQKKLYVASTTNFTVGDKIVINRGGEREEEAEVYSIAAGDYLTLVDNLTYEHTNIQADDVEICGTTNTVSEEDEDFGTGVYSLEITGLEYDTIYRYRAYAVNSVGTGYGDWESFTTDKTTPTVTVQPVTNVLPTSVTANGTITATGGENCSERGFEYGLTKTATWSVKQTVGGYGVGTFSIGLTGLTANTSYWIRAYAKNSIGTGYSDWIQFQTAAAGIIPTGTKIHICSDYSGYTYKLMRSETDDGEVYEAYFVVSTDLTNKQGLAYYKRILDLWLYFNKENSGTVTIYVKRDNEADWQTVGTVTLTGDEDIIIKHLAVDIRGKTFLFKLSASNHFEFLGYLFEFIKVGMR